MHASRALKQFFLEPSTLFIEYFLQVALPIQFFLQPRPFF
jgi:hypothetical protein